MNLSGRDGALPKSHREFCPINKSQTMGRSEAAGFPGELRAASGQVACGRDRQAPKEVLSSQGQGWSLF